MTTIEATAPTLKRAGVRPALTIRFYFVDGSEETFIQAEAGAAEAIRDHVNLSSLFHQSRIVVADEYSKSVFVCSQINRIDLVFNGPGFPTNVPPDHADLVELTKAEFAKRVPVNEPSRLEKREQHRHVGDLLVSFLDLRMRGGRHVYLMNETLVKLPAENQSFMHRLLSKGPYRIRLREGGFGVLNLQNLIGYTVYPGVPEVPADTWVAQPKAIYGRL
jgi:hypothetical protein